MTDNASRLVTKYALVLSFLYVISYVFNKVLMEIDFGDEPYRQTMIRGNAPWIFNLILNIFTAIVINIDANKNKVSARYISLATILYRPVGVFAFLLFYILGDKGNKK